MEKGGHIHPEKKTWAHYLEGRKVVCIAGAAGKMNDTPEQNEKAIERWCEMTRKFHIRKGAREEDIIFIKDKAYNEKNEAALLKAINDPDTCLFDFSWGDQRHLVETLSGTPVAEALKQRYFLDPNIVVFTTSASASALSKHMMDYGDIYEGLGWLSNIIVDTHMHREGKIPRMERLQEQVAQHKNCVGLGIDEKTALVLHNGHGTVIGDNNVYLVGMEHCGLDESNVPTHCPGKKIDLRPHAAVPLADVIKTSNTTLGSTR